MAKFLITGVAGFIASRVAEMLLKEGHEVVGVDNLNDYYDVRLKYYRLWRLLSGHNAPPGFQEVMLSRLKQGVLNDPDKMSDLSDKASRLFDQLQSADERFEFRKIDIEDQARLEGLFGEHEFDAVVNLAARAGVRYSMENPHVYATTNTIGTLNLLECMRKKGIKKMVLASTSSLYAGQSMPFKESLAVNTPLSPYAASKKAAEAMAYSYHYLYDMDISVVRYFTVFGPAGRPDMSYFRFIQWIEKGLPIEIFGDGSQSRDFTYVDDIARGTLAAIKPVGYEIINLGGGNNPISLNEVIEHLEKYLGMAAETKKLAFHKADMMSTHADISKAKRLLNWEPRVNPFDGLKLTVDWYLQNRDWVREVQL